MLGEGFLEMFLGSEYRASLMNKELRKAGVKDTDACYQWAFGDGWGSLAVSVSDEKWNELHSDLFIVAGSDSIKETTGKIGRAYVEHCKRNTITIR